MRKEDTPPEDGYDVTEERKIFVSADNRDTIIQTDKPIYKPGQTGENEALYRLSGINLCTPVE